MPSRKHSIQKSPGIYSNAFDSTIDTPARPTLRIPMHQAIFDMIANENIEDMYRDSLEKVEEDPRNSAKPALISNH